MSIQQQTQTTFTHRLRRWVVAAIIISFSIAALGGIVVLLSGAWSETAAKVLGTTALTGLFSVTVLCGVALLGKSLQWFGWITIVISLATLTLLLSQLWNDFAGEYAFKIDVTMCVLSAACAVISLLLLLVANNRRSVQSLLWVTIGLIGLGVILSLVPVWVEELGDHESYWRATGVVWILAALGVVVLPVMSLLLRRTQQADELQSAPHSRDEMRSAAPSAGSSATRLSDAALSRASLSPASLERIAAAAEAEGITADELIERLLP